MKKISFVKYENEFIHEFNDLINKSEDFNDASNAFSHIAKKIFTKIINEEYKNDIDIKDEDFDVDFKNEKYKISKKLFSNETIKKMYEESDIEAILERFLKSVLNRAKHLKNLDKKNKIDRR
ncbi:MAG: hypothetical protein N3A58_02085 [Spirochaetes bacterium]|nr:hypothetical protein [Spirochaetota bacterium]